MNQNFIGDECEKGEDFDRDGFLGHHKNLSLLSVSSSLYHQCHAYDDDNDDLHPR